MHLVVVGGKGFVGRHFVVAAIARGHQVTVVGRSQAAGNDQDQPAYRSGGLRALASDTALLQSADRICHFATSTTPASSNADPLTDIAENLSDTVLLLEAMRHAGNRKIIFLSSGGAVYGQPHYVPMDENHPLNPISSYGVVKVAIENYLRLYQANYAFEPTIVRLANPYGPGQSSIGQLGAVNTFIQLAQNEQTATLWGDGSTIRDFVYISDVVDLLLACVEGSALGTFNCGGGKGTTLLELIAAVEKETKKTLQREFKPGRAFDPKEVVLDVSRAFATFGWSPKVPLSKGIAATMAN